MLSEIRSSLAKAEVLTEIPVVIIFHKLIFICAFRVFAYAALSASDNKVEEQLGW